MKVPDSLKKKPRFKLPDVKDFKDDMETLGEQIADGFKDKVIDNIETNAYGFSLKEETVKRKGSDLPLVDTGELVGSIYRDGTTVSVEDSPRKDSPLTNKELAIVHEYGTKDKHIPARPVWRNTFEDYQEEAEAQIKEFLDSKDKKFKAEKVRRTPKKPGSRKRRKKK